MSKIHAPLRVLIVEDESLIRWALSETLKAAGHSVTASWDAATAMRALASASAVDVVLLDLRLPDCDDLQLLADIRRAAPASAVVMMTAHATAESAADARALGAYAVITKPFDLNGIEALLVDACQARLH